jgi:SCP-2 sterol transfer family
MSTFLSPEWVEGVVGAGAAPGPSTTVQVVVGGAPEGDVKWYLRVDDGVIAAAGVGTLAGAEVSLTVPYADALAMLAGDLDPNVAFMRGRMKTAGDAGVLLDLLAATATPGYRAWREQLAATTET